MKQKNNLKTSYERYKKKVESKIRRYVIKYAKDHRMSYKEALECDMVKNVAQWYYMQEMEKREEKGSHTLTLEEWLELNL